ncbi:hypothetical protein B0H21DRAFT_709144 [Amylocystis lapponica]|nr:hypothetical protein B0H21DRAFT_709144 [Amylocystis lapponica]
MATVLFSPPKFDIRVEQGGDAGAIAHSKMIEDVYTVIIQYQQQSPVRYPGQPEGPLPDGPHLAPCASGSRTVLYCTRLPKKCVAQLSTTCLPYIAVTTASVLSANVRNGLEISMERLHLSLAVPRCPALSVLIHGTLIPFSSLSGSPPTLLWFPVIRELIWRHFAAQPTSNIPARESPLALICVCGAPWAVHSRLMVEVPPHSVPGTSARAGPPQLHPALSTSTPSLLPANMSQTMSHPLWAASAPASMAVPRPDTQMLPPPLAAFSSLTSWTGSRIQPFTGFLPPPTGNVAAQCRASAHRTRPQHQNRTVGPMHPLVQVSGHRQFPSTLQDSAPHLLQPDLVITIAIYPFTLRPIQFEVRYPTDSHFTPPLTMQNNDVPELLALLRSAHLSMDISIPVTSGENDPIWVMLDQKIKQGLAEHAIELSSPPLHITEDEFHRLRFVVLDWGRYSSRQVRVQGYLYHSHCTVTGPQFTTAWLYQHGSQTAHPLIQHLGLIFLALHYGHIQAPVNSLGLMPFQSTVVSTLECPRTPDPPEVISRMHPRSPGSSSDVNPQPCARLHLRSPLVPFALAATRLAQPPQPSTEPPPLPPRETSHVAAHFYYHSQTDSVTCITHRDTIPPIAQAGHDLFPYDAYSVLADNKLDSVSHDSPPEGYPSSLHALRLASDFELSTWVELAVKYAHGIDLSAYPSLMTDEVKMEGTDLDSLASCLIDFLTYKWLHLHDESPPPFQLPHGVRMYKAFDITIGAGVEHSVLSHAVVLMVQDFQFWGDHRVYKIPNFLAGNAPIPSHLA